MPIASGAGHWPKEHIVNPPPVATPKPSGPSFVQSYVPQWIPPNKLQPTKKAYIINGNPSPSNPNSPYPSPNYPSKGGPPSNSPSDPSSGQANPGYDTPPPRYNSSTPNGPKNGGYDGNPGNPNNGNQSPWNTARNINRNPPNQAKPARFLKASEKYGQPGHYRFGSNGPRPDVEYGHTKYGVQYDAARQVINPPKGARPVGPKGLESWEVYGPRMNMTTGLCGPQMRPCLALLGGLLALGALAGIFTAAGLVAKSKQNLKKPLPYVNPLRSIRYYQQNGAMEPCVDRYATTTVPKTTTKAPTTTSRTTTRTSAAPTTCVPLTINTATTAAKLTAAACTVKVPVVVGGTTSKSLTANIACTTPTTPRPTTINICTTSGPSTTPLPTTTAAPTTTVPTTTPEPTSTTTLPFCDTLTTSYTLVTLYPLQIPVAAASKPSGITVFLLIVSILAKLLIG